MDFSHADSNLCEFQSKNPSIREVLDASLMQMSQKKAFKSIVVRQQNNNADDDDDDGVEDETVERQRMINLRQIFNRIYDTVEMMNDMFK